MIASPRYSVWTLGKVCTHFRLVNEPLPLPRPRARSALRYAVAIFLSSSLLFLLEPLAGKRLLPLLGGSAAVWTACLVFFQCALLLGYLLAHGLVTRTSTRAQVAAYVALLVLSLGQLIASVDPVVHADTDHPILSVLRLLTILIGIPFVTLSMTSPLLQSWYARSALHTAITEGPTTRPFVPTACSPSRTSARCYRS